MFAAQTSALAAQFASLKGCRKSAEDNIPGDWSPITSRTGGALEHSPGTLWRINAGLNDRTAFGVHLMKIPKEISAKDVASGLCPDKFAGKPCVSGQRSDATIFVNAVLQRFPLGLRHSMMNLGRSLEKIFTKVAFSGFLLGNREKIAVVANDDSSLWPAKMPP